jgi:hypothetical protein
VTSTASRSSSPTMVPVPPWQRQKPRAMACAPPSLWQCCRASRERELRGPSTGAAC